MAGTSLLSWMKRFITNYLPLHRGASECTIDTYAFALKLLCTFLVKKKRRRKLNPADITAENILSYLAHLEKERGCSARTRNSRLAAVMSFARYLFVMGQLKKENYDRLRHIAFKRLTPPLPEHLEAREIQAVFETVDYKTADGFRDLAILKLMYNTGARASEISGLKISDVDLKGRLVTIFGKGGKTRRCGLWQTTAAMIRIYIETERRTPHDGYEDCLFINQRRRPFTRFGINQLVKRYVLRASEKCPSLAKKVVTAHTIRHTTGVHLVEAGVDINTIREWLGHERMTSTEIYARANLAVKQQALAKLEQFDKRLFEEATVSRKKPDLKPAIRRWLQ